MPSAVNAREIDISVDTPEAVYTYDATGNRLLPVAAGDLRAAAVVNLVYVAGLKQERGATAEMYAAAGTGFIARSVFLFCASEGLGTVVRASIDKPALAEKLKLRPEQRIILAQSVGYPKKNSTLPLGATLTRASSPPLCG